MHRCQNLSLCSTKGTMTSSGDLTQREEQALELIYKLLSLTHPPAEEEIDPVLFDNPLFQKVYSYIWEVRELSSALQAGELHSQVNGRGFILGNMKAMRSDLLHLSWQIDQVAKGDFNQEVDFLGDFSRTFNKMIHNLAEMSARLRDIANHDGLTKLYNRANLDKYLKKVFAEVREKDQPMSLMMIDIDFFKKVNDRYGHHAGDLVLVKLADILRQLSPIDMVARYGGEEFMCVLPGMYMLEAVKLGEKLLDSVRKASIELEDGKVISITISIGISILLSSDTNINEVVKRSDNALYAAKNGGRNRICCQTL